MQNYTAKITTGHLYYKLTCGKMYTVPLNTLKRKRKNQNKVNSYKCPQMFFKHLLWTGVFSSRERPVTRDAARCWKLGLPPSCSEVLSSSDVLGSARGLTANNGGTTPIKGPRPPILVGLETNLFAFSRFVPLPFITPPQSMHRICRASFNLVGLLEMHEHFSPWSLPRVADFSSLRSVTEVSFSVPAAAPWWLFPVAPRSSSLSSLSETSSPLSESYNERKGPFLVLHSVLASSIPFKIKSCRKNHFRRVSKVKVKASSFRSCRYHRVNFSTKSEEDAANILSHKTTTYI